jgi:hypothetical protein
MMFVYILFNFRRARKESWGKLSGVEDAFKLKNLKRREMVYFLLLLRVWVI